MNIGVGVLLGTKKVRAGKIGVMGDAGEIGVIGEDRSFT